MGSNLASPNSLICESCGNSIPMNRSNCPHCGRPRLFQNVNQSRTVQAELEQRYQAAKSQAVSRGCEQQVQDFETACENSVAVFCCHLERLFKTFTDGSELYGSFSQLEKLRLRYEKSIPEWEKLRKQVEIELYGIDPSSDDLHYAALSLDGEGLKNYGNCTILLRESMISHRATCFEGNSAQLFSKTRSIDTGWLSAWDLRHKLCVAKLSLKIDASVTPPDFVRMLLTNGKTSSDDNYVEVHILGPMTARTFEYITWDSTNQDQTAKIYWKAVKEKLQNQGVKVIEK